MAGKIYIKRGLTSEKERGMVKAIQKAIDAKKIEDPSYSFDKVCRNYEELKKVFKEMCTEEIPYEEVKTSTLDFGEQKEKDVEEKIKDLNKGDADYEISEDEGKTWVDPFNRANPIVREYVNSDNLSKSGATASTEGNNTTFNEPLNFGDAFALPEDEENPVVEEKGKKKGAKAPKTPRSKKEPSEPINPDFSNMTAAKQKKNTKLFAKYIVEAVCALAEKGFVYFATSDINEAKLTEYEISGELDLNILLTLENGQQATVKRWFLQQNITAEQLAVVDQESKDELAEALGEVMLEKGFAPTPMQTLLIVAGKIFIIDKGLKLLEMKMQTNSVLNQLRAMKAETQEQEVEEEAPREEIVNNPINDVVDTIYGGKNKSVEDGEATATE